MFKRISLTVVLTFLLIANINLLAQDQPHKKSRVKFLPVLVPEFDLGLTLSLKTGTIIFSDQTSGTHFLSGVEAAFNCLMIKPAKGKIRTQFSYNRNEDNELTIHTIELNPYYMYDVTDKFSIGGVPELDI